jgi:2-polyprenyl-6-methoxyphenol hydroxylase-like FAD-dependent oxidoreductase
MTSLTTTCAISGGGPAGIMAGFLLARAGIDVVVLEKHKDFLRDFRGDTIHPSTLELMWELGLLDRFLARGPQEVRETTAEFGEERFRVADFSLLPTHAKFLAFMPQWDFLDFLVCEASRYRGFRLFMQSEATELRHAAGRITGVRALTSDGPLDIAAQLVIAADGRHSRLRAAAGLKLREIGSTIDVLWFKLPVHHGDPTEPVGRFGAGQVLVMIHRGDYWQCALVIPKGGFEELKRTGMGVFQAQLREIAGFACDRVEAIQSFDDVSLLSVKVDRLKRWATKGFLCIGDAAHAMSPVGGVGINLAVQDAVAAANILAPILSGGNAPALRDLNRVQRQREWPARATQAFQVLVQNRVLVPGMRTRAQPQPPAIVRLLNRVRWLRQFPARFLGLGVRPEHIRTEDCLQHLGVSDRRNRTHP